MATTRRSVFSGEDEEEEGGILPTRRSIRHSRVRLGGLNLRPNPGQRGVQDLEEEEEEEDPMGSEEEEGRPCKSPPFFQTKSPRIGLSRSHLRRLHYRKQVEKHAQFEFERRYSKDLRSRRRHNSYKVAVAANNNNSPRRRSSQRRLLDVSERGGRYTQRTRLQKRGENGMMEEEGKDDEHEDDEGEGEDAENEEKSSPKRKRRRESSKTNGSTAYPEDEDEDLKEDEEPLSAKYARSSRLRREEEEKENSSYLENRSVKEPPSGSEGGNLRRSTRCRRSNQKYEISDLSDLDLSGRSRRGGGKKKGSASKKPNSSQDDAEGDVDEDEDETEYEDKNFVMPPDAKKSSPVHQRPQRSRIPVNRLTYTNFRQYSSEDELKVASASQSRRRYNMRHNRRATNRYNTKSSNAAVVPSRSSRRRATNHKKKISYGSDSDESDSSSSSPSADETRFEKRKAKRMLIEKSKMMPVNMKAKDLEMALIKDRTKVGSSMADVSPMDLDLDISFDSVRGIDEHINSLKEMVIFPLLYPELFSKYEISPPRGVLFYGPPGTGKTLVARALASEISKEGKKVAFFMRKGADCLSKWIGESERQLRLLFDQAYLMRPSIIFFDEIDGLAPIRSSRQDQIHSSIVSTLLALMDGLDNRGEIIVIGATNRIDSIDPALRRPGRFDRELRFSLPTRKARKEILQLHVRKWEPIIKDEVLDHLADNTIGYCGADLKGLCGEAALNALRRRYPQVYKTMEKLSVDFQKIQVLKDDFDVAIRGMIPSSHRIADQFQSPLPLHIRPLLNTVYGRICHDIDRIFPIDGAFRPRILLCAEGSGHGQTTYLGPAILHHLERLPAQKLDIPALFSNSARSPEEALSQIIREAKRALPGILYIPHISKLWSTVSDTVHKTFLSMIHDIPPTAQLLILAISDETYPDLPEELQELFLNSHKEVFNLELPGEKERMEFFQPVFVRALAPITASVAPVEEEPLPVVSSAGTKRRMLTEKEEKKLRKKEEHRLRELRIFLRDVHLKITREQKFFMFRSPVNLEEVFDYLDIIKKPMDFDAMLVKLDKEEYKCAKDYLDDIDLITDNAIAYNSDLNYETNRIICHQAAALRDFSYALVKQEMDTDFEEECREISERRKKLVQELEELTAQEEESKRCKDDALPTSSNEVVVPAAVAPSRHQHRRASRWSRGEVAKKKKKLSTSTPSEDHSLEHPSGSPIPSTSETLPDTDHIDSNDLITLGIRIDAQKLQERKLELVKATKGFSVERLERVLAKCLNVVDAYKSESDRTQLPSDLQIQVDIVKTQQTRNHR